MITPFLTILLAFGGNESIVKVDVSPSQISLPDPFASSQLLITGELIDGTQIDLTAEAEVLSSPSFIEVSSSLLVRPTSNGSGTLRLKVNDRTLNVRVRSSGTDKHPVPDFELDVQPILTRIGCNAGTCHGSAQGKDGFFLSLRGYDAVADHLALTDDLAGRRVNLAAPKRSLFLQKPTGAVPHQG
ncbi:MAG: hypothetical protein MK291_13315, partial [Planctomycetes bacterium]|nr:hypothetical protein [Planctomycetota bacterium]